MNLWNVQHPTYEVEPIQLPIAYILGFGFWCLISLTNCPLSQTSGQSELSSSGIFRSRYSVSARYWSKLHNRTSGKKDDQSPSDPIISWRSREGIRLGIKKVVSSPSQFKQGHLRHFFYEKKKGSHRKKKHVKKGFDHFSNNVLTCLALALSFGNCDPGDDNMRPG